MHQKIPSGLILLWGVDASINGFQICIWNFKIPNKCVFVIWIFFTQNQAVLNFTLWCFGEKVQNNLPKKIFFLSQPVGWDGEFSGAFFIHNRHHNGSISDWNRGEQNGCGSGTGARGSRFAAQFHSSGSLNKHLWKRGLQNAKGWEGWCVSQKKNNLCCIYDTKRNIGIFTTVI